MSRIQGYLPKDASLLVVVTHADQKLMSETLIKQVIKFDSFPLTRQRYVEVVGIQGEGGLKVRNEIEDIFRNKG